VSSYFVSKHLSLFRDNRSAELACIFPAWLFVNWPIQTRLGRLRQSSYLPTNGCIQPGLSAVPMRQAATALMSGPDVDKIQISENEERRYSRNSILVSPFVQAFRSGGRCFAFIGFVRLPKTRGGGDPHLS
jgi:hypothetical protein